ncbi:MAG: hypothetical protein ABIJ16_03250 [Bacteroidota bacterium]
MKQSLVVTKYRQELQNGDFDEYPVWEIVRSDSVDNEPDFMIRPLSCSLSEFRKKLENSEVFEAFYVKTVFTASNGNLLNGYCRISNRDCQYLLQPYEPVVIVDDRHIPFWHGMQLPSNEQMVDYYMTMRINPGNLFPLRMKIIPDTFHIAGEGIIEGFTGQDESLKDVYIRLN